MAPPRRKNKTGFTIGDDDQQTNTNSNAASSSSIPNTTSASTATVVNPSEETNRPPPRRDPPPRLPKFTTIPDSAADSEEDDWHPNSGPQTPNIIESAQQLRRSLSVHGLHELANMPPNELRKSVGKKIWRPQDEEVRMPTDWERLAVHVVRGGIRGFNLAFMLRGSVMIVFALIKAIRTK